MADQDRVARVRALLDGVRRQGRTALTAPEGKQIADAYGIAVPGEELARDEDEAVTHAERLGGPVVMKIVSPDILHKTDAGGVLVGVEEEPRYGPPSGRSSRTPVRTTPAPGSTASRCRS